MKSSQPFPSLFTRSFAAVIDFGNRYFTLGGYIFKRNDKIFRKIELMLVTIAAISIFILATIDKLPFWAGIVVSVVLTQRILEYLIVYSRNFIFNKGRVFTHFKSGSERSQWLIMMFFINIFQVIITFAILYRFLSVHSPSAFSHPLSLLDSLYFSVITSLTVGYGDIVPLSQLAKLLVMFHGMFVFYTMVIVVNGLISLHFSEQDSSKPISSGEKHSR